ncbi:MULTISPECIES: putative 7-carboxy-7-deazaguanine synthase QueE [Clostridium]|uniref:7-carboxy-7-deazaguanine synthase n=1 Tax=Clostridium novyi (strain NT) TaxID=386415 RepID=A0Q1F6_CLONN|nr:MULTISPECIES: putative 7-carboxy-7-deazaguanine synthase QueE [Clostridium]ABK61304.1 Fe-S oxidoreductase of MoaA family CAC3625 [Clostridium novyi NT]KEH88185.1 radical SAM protein [Clostridium novyi A str. NCTC 538]KEH89390.1 radical SAM protein [Clostridium novyi A str. 4540]KEH91311.1 radical SAM protein [Clostridium novyi A str. BKT29909]KEH92953.1 radical SAM protein [Clostridium botulinum C/D str. It1]
MNYKVVEKFISINGEGKSSGQLSVFIRFAGCNLNCSYCDTKWANEEKAPYSIMTEKEIYEYIKLTEIKNVTLTGGEPLLQEGILTLLKLLCSDENLNIEIETNGSIPLKDFTSIKNNPPKFTMDYKLPYSNMENHMITDNFNYLTKKDVIKFVVANKNDLQKLKSIIYKYNLIDKTNIYISPVYGEIEMNSIVEFMKENKLNGVTLQMQLHKIIWDPNKRGV